MHKTTAALFLGSALLLPALVGCSDSSKAKIAKEIVCDRAEDIREALDEVAEEVADNDLADAREEIAELRSDFNSLSSRTDQLSESNRDAIKPLLADAETALASLEAAPDIAGIKAALDSGRGAIEAVATTAESTLSCDD